MRDEIFIYAWLKLMQFFNILNVYQGRRNLLAKTYIPGQGKHRTSSFLHLTAGIDIAAFHLLIIQQVRLCYIPKRGDDEKIWK